MAAAPRAPRAFLLLAVALALLLGFGAAFSSASRQSIAGGAGFSSSASGVMGAAARLHRAPVDVLDLEFPDAPVRRHLVAFAFAPAGRRRLLSFPAESLEAHEAVDFPGDAAAPAAAPPAGAEDDDDDADRVSPLPPRAPSTFITDAGVDDGDDQGGFLARDDLTGATNMTRSSLLALASAPLERSLLALPASSPGPADDAAARAPAATPAGQGEQGCERGSSEVPLPPRAACTFVTYVSGAGKGALEFASTDQERAFVIREHTSASNRIAANATAPNLSCGSGIPSPDDDMDLEWDSDCDGDDEDGDFTKAMEQFCSVLGYSVTAMNAVPWLLRARAWLRRLGF